MPHIRLEHSEEIETEVLLKNLHLELSRSNSIDINTIKSRSIPIKSYIVGNGRKALFISLTIELMRGRPEKTLSHILSKLDHMIKIFAQGQDFPIAYSTKIIEIDERLYRTKNIC